MKSFSDPPPLQQKDAIEINLPENQSHGLTKNLDEKMVSSLSASASLSVSPSAMLSALLYTLAG
jgi:hypothetical protein